MGLIIVILIIFKIGLAFSLLDSFTDKNYNPLAMSCYFIAIIGILLICELSMNKTVTEREFITEYHIAKKLLKVEECDLNDIMILDYTNSINDVITEHDKKINGFMFGLFYSKLIANTEPLIIKQDDRTMGY